MRRRGLALLALALLAGTPVAAQSSRFGGWGEMLDPGYHFDPDERSVLTFSVQSSPSSRAAFDEFERLLARGDPAAAARVLLDVMARQPEQVLQVAEDPSDGGGRWVGVGEWALYLLSARIAPDVLATVATPEERHRLANASGWRDVTALRGLTWALEGLPEGRQAAEALARLWAEQGRATAAAAAARRAQAQGAGAGMDRLAAGAEVELRSAPLELDLVQSLGSTWPVTDLAWLGRPLTISRLVVQDRRAKNPFLGRLSSLEAPFAPVTPVVDDGVVFLADSLSLSALDLVSGRTLWHHAGAIEVVESEGTWGHDFDLGVYVAENRPRAISPYLVARPVVLDDRVLASCQVAEPWHELDEFDTIPINHPLPWRRLVCVDRDDGRVLWRQDRPALGPDAFVNRLNVHGPPACEGGVAYAAGSIIEGAINCYAAAFDLDTGELLWRTLLCTGQQELTMFNRPFQEHLIAPVGLHDGSLFVCSNLGVVACLDAWSGRLRWVTSYEATERRSSRNVRPDTARQVYWHNEAPFVEDGVLVVAPSDSEWLLGLDPRTGRRRWKVGAMMRPQRSPVRHQALATGDGRVLLVSDSGTEAFEAASGRMLWQTRPFGPYDELSGAAVLAGDRLLVPAHPALLVIDAHDGRLLESPSAPELGSGRLLQRVVPAGPALVMNDGSSLFAHVDLAELATRNLPKAAHDPRADLTLAELALVGQRFDEASDRYRRVLRAGDAGLVQRARSGLAAASLARARLLDSGEAWAAVLASASDDDQRLQLCDLVLPALDRVGAEDLLVEWLGRLAALAPERPLELDDEGPRPLHVQHLLRSVPREPPARRVALLQELIATRADGRWDGLPLPEAARRRIDALLAAHGRALYEPFEREAEARLAEGLSLEAVGRLYPNADLVARGKVARLEELLAAGRTEQVFEEARDGSVPELRSLRARAARALGESAYADALEGRPAPPDDELPALPADGSGSLSVMVHAERDVIFRTLRGRASPELAGCAVGFVDGLGELFCLDTRTGRVLWSGLALPGGARSASGSVDLVVHDDLLLVRGRDELAAYGLADGRPRWSHRITGQVLDLVSVAGLLVTLVESPASRDMRIEAHGMATGLQAFRIDLEDAEEVRLYRVGQHVVCHTIGAYEHSGLGSDKRLVVIDPRMGELTSVTSVGDRQSVVRVCDDPPMLFLAERLPRGSRLTAWSPETRGVAWEADLDSLPDHGQLVVTAPGHALLRERVAAPGRPRPDRDLLVPIDVARGMLPSPAGAPLLRVLDPPAGAGPQVVLIDPDDSRRIVVLDGITLERRFELPLDSDPLPLSNTRVFQGRDGFLVVSTRHDPDEASLWVVRGEEAGQRYSVILDDLPRRGVQVMLVDGAVLLASGGNVRILRSATP